VLSLRAVALLLRGDATRLEGLFETAPGLVRARRLTTTGHYCGYFHGATLLHHVAGNPFIRPLPANVVELVELLVKHGAEVDAVTLAGPAQPNDIGWTTLGLVASSLEARRAGKQEALMSALVEHGADVDARNGGPLMGALYYGEHAAARWLVAHGGRTDLVAAAGLGRIDLLEQHIGGELRTLVDYTQRPGAARSRADLLSLALVYACRGGHRDAVQWLVDHGANPLERVPFDHGATPLHWAALEGHEEIIDLLLALGADLTVRDESFDATPRGWAEHGGHPRAAAKLSLDR
jgi:ankyrin repeat protein